MDSSVRQNLTEVGNDALARFIGWTPEEPEGSWYETTDCAKYVAYSVHNNYPHKDLPFHRDWNYLMKVVRKIESLGQTVLIFNHYCFISKDIYSMDSLKDVTVSLKGDKMDAVWLACVKFVNKLNRLN